MSDASRVLRMFVGALERGMSTEEATAYANGLWKPARKPEPLPPPPEAVAEKLAATTHEAPHPLDRDGDGQPGGSLPADQRGDDVEALRAEYEALIGSAPDKRWGAPRLKKEIEKAKG